MNEDIRNRLLGGPAPDPGCEACFELLDQYAEASVRGADLALLFPEIIAHLESCDACREDTEGFVAMLRSQSAEERE
jgi:hypothetical protein